MKENEQDKGPLQVRGAVFTKLFRELNKALNIVELLSQCIISNHFWSTCVLCAVCSFVIMPHILAFERLHSCHDTAAPNCVLVCFCGLPTYRDVSPELGHIVVVAAEELGEPTDRPLAAFVHCFITFKVFIVFVD